MYNRLIIGLIIFLAIKFIFSPLIAGKINLRCLKNFVIANSLAITVSILILLVIIQLKDATGLRFSVSRLVTPIVCIALISVESIFYCKVEKAVNNYEIISTILLANLIACAISIPYAINSHGKPDKFTLRISCRSNLKQIGLALKQYAMDNNNFLPAKPGAEGLEKLRCNGYLADYKIYRCPFTKDAGANSGQELDEKSVDYIYRAGYTATDKGTDASTIPVAWDKSVNHEDYGNVLFLDGHVHGYTGKNWIEQAGIKNSP